MGIEQLDDHLMKRTAQELSVLDQLPPKQILLGAKEAFLLIGQLQLALRHPLNNDVSARGAEQMARALQAAFFSPHCATYQALEVGWNSDIDCTPEEFEAKFPGVKTQQKPPFGWEDKSPF